MHSNWILWFGNGKRELATNEPEEKEMAFVCIIKIHTIYIYQYHIRSEFVWVAGNAYLRYLLVYCESILFRFITSIYLLRLNGGLFFTVNFRHCKWIVAMNGWLIVISAINAAAINVYTYARTDARTNKRTQSVGQTEIMCKRCAWNEENWLLYFLYNSVYYYADYIMFICMLFETCTQRDWEWLKNPPHIIIIIIIYTLVALLLLLLI